MSEAVPDPTAGPTPSARPDDATVARFGDWELELASGELRAADGRTARLPPQPAALLALLLERAGEVLGREEIAARLWPDVHVEVDKSLSFCLRQLRVALHEDAAAPRLIETLPRRGVRLLVVPSWLTGSSPPASTTTNTPTVPPTASASAPTPAPPIHRSRHPGRWAPSIVLAVLALATLAVIAARYRAGGMPVLAIMPFSAPADAIDLPDARPLALALVDTLTRELADRAAVLGPTTTAAYATAADPVRELAANRHVDFVLNGRWLPTDDGPRLLVEVIRTRDGAHVWVRRFAPETGAWPRAAVEVTKGLHTDVFAAGDAR